MSSRPPWFPGQYGRPDDDGAAFTGEPYADDSEAEPYAPASLHTDASNPYGDVPVDAGGPDPGEVPDWLSRSADPTGRPPGTASPAAAQATDLGDGAPTGYESFYEPGSRGRSSWKPRKRRSFRARRHGPRGEHRADPSGLVAKASEEAAPSREGSPEITVRYPATSSPAMRWGAVTGGSTSTDTGTGTGTGSAGTSGTPSGRSRRGRWAVASGLGVGVLLVLAVIGATLGDDDEPDPTTAPTLTSPAPSPSFSPLPPPSPLPSPTAVAPPEGEVTVGATVDDGPVRAEVLGVTTGLSELSGTTASATAAGEYVVVRLRVTATAPGAWFVDTDQRLTDADGTEHLPDVGAGMAVDGNRLWFAELKEGESAEGVVVFDVPPGTVPATLTVHGSATGAGAPVALPVG
ncbi:DUF4352 domain-containing protein [Georgenia subflava]|uniref:DUF4352 domain-containing protein n=1 Tax=Georgenia subflava TaxID=1622177 RepID=A0A6N7EHJ8_9MICO|nr:DUF4352 domain-containing protein [Georgenia subflava]MPV37852.1 DUF4352 domain-containing protein [Georgenia subflava]